MLYYEKGKGIEQKRSILGTFYLNGYIEKHETNTYIYYDIENKNKAQNTELLMLNQVSSKYLWENIKNKTSK